MMKNVIKYIFIYIICLLFVGCENNVLGGWDASGECDYCYLEIEAPNLQMDTDGVYHLNFNAQFQSAIH